MKATELRIGNIIRDKRAPEYQSTVVAILENDEIIPDMDINGMSAAWNVEEYEGIPLTEEWLLKFGFEADSETASWSILISLDKSDFLFEVGCRDDWHLYYRHIEIPYVHQLQNLYFALTGQELTIKT